jgi:hypothetical protein
MVSIQITSAPPAFSPSICSANTSAAAASVIGPIGSNRSPVGPTEPATITRRPAASATARALRAARRLRSKVRSSSRCSASLRRMPPKLLVRMMSAPASTNIWCRLRMRSGWRSFHSSGASPLLSPMSNRLVPVAPSASSQSRP